MTGGVLCCPQGTFTSGNTIGNNDGYKKIKTLGRGSYGKTMLCVNCEDGTNVVVKRINVEGGKQSRMKHIMREVQVMKTTRHPHIITFVSAWQSSKAVYITMKHAERGDLEQLVVYSRSNSLLLGEARVKKICCQTASALGYLHEKHIIHRDIKAANVFIDAEGDVKLGMVSIHTFHCFLASVINTKTGDFGMSTILEPAESFASTHVGTPFYMSPELMEKTKYTSKTDIWAFGVLVYLLMYFSYPFVGETLKELKIVVLEGKVRHPPRIRYSSMLSDIVEECLEVDPEDRPSAKSLALLLAHQSIKKRPPPTVLLSKKRRPGTDQIQQAADLMIFLFEEASDRLLIECSATLCLVGSIYS